MKYPSKLLENAIHEISCLPGIGKRTALRLILHILRRPKEKTKALTFALNEMIEHIKTCKECHNICDEELCDICKSPNRDRRFLCIVEDIRDVIAIESTSQYKGLYHVLGGKISPIDGIGPAQLNIKSIPEKLKENKIAEVIFAMSSTMEADTTIFYIYKQIGQYQGLVSTISRGISVGDELEYADEITLGRSIVNRIPYEKSLKRS